MKKIVFDARVCDGRVHGISRVAEQLVKNLFTMDSPYHYTILCSNDYGASLVPRRANISYKLLKAPVYGVREQFVIVRELQALKADLYHSPTFSAPYCAPCPVVMHIHDLIPLVYPEFFPFKYKIYYSLLVKQLARKATHIIASSHCSEQDIIRLLGITPEKISVMYNATFAADEKIEPFDLGALQPGYVLYVGNEKTHKNFIRAVQAFAKARFKIKDRFVQMAAVGISPEFFKASEVRSIPDIHCFKHVAPEHLRWLYSQAGMLFFPSLYEGFGIPPLEAMLHGTPVVASNTSSLPEILDDAYYPVNPLDIDDMANGICTVLQDASLRSGLIEKGTLHEQKYSWSRAAEHVLNIYNGLLK